MLHTTETTLEMTRELTDCRIFGTLTGAVEGGGDTRQHAATRARETILGRRDGGSSWTKETGVRTR